jgi:hypothetical protein
MVAGEDDHVLESVSLDDVDVLAHGISRALTIAFETLAAGKMSAPFRSGAKFQPRCRWRISECALYWVATPGRRMPN